MFLAWHTWGPNGVVTGIAAIEKSVPDSTRYAPRYSEAAFQKVLEGQTQAQVTALLGKPLQVVREGSPPDGAEQWVYSDSPSRGSHYVRTVRFSKAGVVVKVYAGYDFE